MSPYLKLSPSWKCHDPEKYGGSASRGFGKNDITHALPGSLHSAMPGCIVVGACPYLEDGCLVHFVNLFDAGVGWSLESWKIQSLDSMLARFTCFPF